MNIEAGTHVYVTTAAGDEIPCIAATGVVPGRDMPVVWVASADTTRAWKMGRMPWPAQHVRTS